jgi:hypothetical protein
MPEPLFTNELFPEIIESANFDRQTSQEIMASCVARLPLAHFEVLKTLVQFLGMFVERAGATAATTSRVSEIFTPLVLYSDSEPLQHAREDGPFRAKLFALLMENYDTIFASRLWHPDRIDQETWAPESAVRYVNLVKDAFGDGHVAVRDFVSIMGAFQDDRCASDCFAIYVAPASNSQPKLRLNGFS